MKKLLSALTALTLTTVSSIPMFSNAKPLTLNKQITSIDEMVDEIFGEDAIVIDDRNALCYIVIAPDNLGDFNRDEQKLKIRLKNNSEFDENSLRKFVWENCTSYVDFSKSESEDNTYIVKRSEIYAGPSSRLQDEIYPEVISLLSECEDVVSIEKYYNVGFETFDGESRILDFSIMVSGSVDFDFDKYADYNVDTWVDNYGMFPQKYYEISAKKGDNYFRDTYNAYVNLTEDYGEENIKTNLCMLDSVLSLSQVCRENVYTALKNGDTNGDGEVNISDVLAITAYVGNSEKNQLSETGLTNADVNGDGVINANDALTIQQYLAGIITEL